MCLNCLPRKRSWPCSAWLEILTKELSCAPGISRANPSLLIRTRPATRRPGHEQVGSGWGSVLSATRSARSFPVAQERPRRGVYPPRELPPQSRPVQLNPQTAISWRPSDPLSLDHYLELLHKVIVRPNGGSFRARPSRPVPALGKRSSVTRSFSRYRTIEPFTVLENPGFRTGTS